MANKCDCYRNEEEIVGWHTPVAFKTKIISRCWGTKELEHCSCDGDPTKCDFYPEVREKALKKREPKFGEWISVEERLPDLEPPLIKWGDRGYKQKSVRVLCTCKQKSGKVLVKEGYYEVWVDSPTDPYWRIPGSIDSVTHWMPLPEPPTEKEN